MIIPRKVYFANLVVLSCALGQSPAIVGTMQVSVTDVQGKPIAGAQVRYQRVYRTVLGVNGLPLPAPGEAVVRSTATADVNGALTTPALAVGDYLLCASVPTAAYLDPCKWQGSLRVSIAANATKSTNLFLTKGVFLRVRVNDPSRLLPNAIDGPMRVGKLVVGVNFGNGAYLGAQNVGVDNAGRDYQIAVPAGMPLSLWLFSRDVVLADSTGKAVDTTGALIPLQATAGQDQAFTFTVKGPAVQSK